VNAYNQRKGGDFGLAITKEKKQELVAQYTDLLSRSRAAILTDYRGLTAAEISGLRNKLREVDGKYHVIKNTLLRLALQNAGQPVPEEMLEGPVAISFCLGEVPPAAKVLVDFAKDSKVLTIKGGLLSGKAIGVEDIQALADLPPREVLLAQVLAGMQSPINGLVTVLSGTLRGLLNVLKARAEQLEGASA
jgi:large subunit ribosomal protein L10